MAAAYSAIANGGVSARPTSSQGDRQPRQAGAVAPDRATQVSRCSRACWRRAAPRRRPRCDGYTLAGKTGTAEKAENGGYSKTKFVASFIGYAPAQQPAPAGGR